MIFSEQSTIIGSAQPMSDFVEGASGDAYESSIVLIRTPTGSFSDIGSYTVNSTNQLFSNSILGHIIPFRNNFPNIIRQFFRKLINPQLLKPSSCHNRPPIMEFFNFSNLTSIKEKPKKKGYFNINQEVTKITEGKLSVSNHK